MKMSGRPRIKSLSLSACMLLLLTSVASAGSASTPISRALSLIQNKDKSENAPLGLQKLQDMAPLNQEMSFDLERLRKNAMVNGESLGLQKLQDLAPFDPENGSNQIADNSRQLRYKKGVGGGTHKKYHYGKHKGPYGGSKSKGKSKGGKKVGSKGGGKKGGYGGGGKKTYVGSKGGGKKGGYGRGGKKTYVGSKGGGKKGGYGRGGKKYYGGSKGGGKKGGYGRGGKKYHGGSKGGGKKGGYGRSKVKGGKKYHGGSKGGGKKGGNGKGKGGGDGGEKVPKICKHLDFLPYFDGGKGDHRMLQFDGELCEPNVYDTMKEDPELSTFVELIHAADLEHIFLCAGPFSVLAPCNDAFNALDPDLIYFLLDPQNQDILQEVLLYHMIPGFYLADDFWEGTVDTIQGEPVTVTLDPLMFNQANVIEEDILACNGVIDVVDDVLIPPSVLIPNFCDPLGLNDSGENSDPYCQPDILVTARQNPELSTFVSLIETADLQDVFLCPALLTVLAPTNEAFNGLDQDLIYYLLDPEHKAFLQEILLYHMIPDYYLADDFQAGPIASVQGEDIEVSLNPLMFNQANAVEVDILACSGVIDTIDDVLVPPSLGPPEPPEFCDEYEFDGAGAGEGGDGGEGCDPNVLETARMDSELSIFVELAELAGLDEIFACAGPFTVLAPDNSAFTDLPKPLLDFLINADNVDVLRDVLFYHVIPGFTLTTEFSAGPVQTLQGQDVEVALDPITFNDADVLSGDILACNGVIDIIGTVLIPEPLGTPEPTVSPTDAPTNQPTVGKTSPPTSAPTPTPETAAPTPTPETAAPTPTPETAAPTPTPETAAPTPTPETSAPTPTAETGAPTAEPTPTPETSAPTPTPETSAPTPTLETAAPTPTPETAAPTPTPETAAPTPTPETAAPTPTQETAAPTPTPETAAPTPTPETAAPTPTPETAAPTSTPGTAAPTLVPTGAPSEVPTTAPSEQGPTAPPEPTTPPPPLRAGVEDYYIAYNTTVDIDPTEEEYAVVLDATKEFFDAYFVQYFADNADTYPDITFVGVDLAIEETQLGAGIPTERYNVFIDFNTSVLYTFDSDPNQIPAPDVTFNIMGDANFTDYIVSYLFPVGNPWSLTRAVVFRATADLAIVEDPENPGDSFGGGEGEVDPADVDTGCYPDKSTEADETDNQKYEKDDNDGLVVESESESASSSSSTVTFAAVGAGLFVMFAIVGVALSNRRRAHRPRGRFLGDKPSAATVSDETCPSHMDAIEASQSAPVLAPDMARVPSDNELCPSHDVEQLKITGIQVETQTMMEI